MFELKNNPDFNIAALCKIAGVSRSGYYKWEKHQPSCKELEDMLLSDLIKKIYYDSKSVFGVERVQLALKVEHGLNIDVKRVRRIMRILGIQSVIRRKRPGYVKHTPEHIAENKMNRDFIASKPNEKWFTDVTYLKYGNNSKAYLSAIIDRFDMSIVAWKIGKFNDYALVEETMKIAFEANPEAKPLIQTDRGSTYTSGMFWELKNTHEFDISMSRISKCLDNQPIEAFWGIYKSEYYNRNKFFDFESLISGTEDYIDFYMNKRYVRKFDGKTPRQKRNESFLIAA